MDECDIREFHGICKDQVKIKLPIEGFRIAHLEQNFLEKGDPIDNFWFVFKKLYRAKTFNRGDLIFAPFAARTIGHNCTNIPIGFPQYNRDRFKVVLHSPHFMARQMGFSQAIPSPYSLDERDQVCLLKLNSMKEIESILARNKEALKCYKQTDCELSNFVTKGSSSEVSFLYHKAPNNRRFSIGLGYFTQREFVRNLSPEKIDALIDKDASTRITSTILTTPNPKMPKSFLSRKDLPHKFRLWSRMIQNWKILVKVISETKARSSQGVSYSEAKSVQQKQPSSPVSGKNAKIAKMRLESSTNKLLISAAEKMIRLLSHSTYEIQTSEELTFKLTRISSCLVENQFPPKYREKVKLFNVIFSNLIRTRHRLNLIRNEAVNAKENNDNLTTAEETMKEKCSRYEKHLEEASLTLESYSKDRETLEKEIATIQVKIKDIDDKVAKIRVPFEKTQSKKWELDANLARIAESKTETSKHFEDLKNEELKEMKIMTEFDTDRLELKTFLEGFLKDKQGYN
ncbi:hypothetical protein PIB30_046626 [Stylosanthes scabra]|uniref:Uncharacterized protein n=1 Tax=Stylosanthes scabra TaxID=79078 RepID=A0ABU6VIF4_9FABA|nr:hypothetical protein [Stylosanthes scabra]